MGEKQKMGSEDLRPDLVLKMDKDVLIIDSTVPFENGLVTLADARRLNVEKYDNLAKEITKAGYNAKVEAVIVGSLGSWDPENDRVLKQIFSSKYLKVTRRIMVSGTISHSKDVFYEHLNHVPQDSGSRHY